MLSNGSLSTQIHEGNCLVQALKRFPKGNINHGLLNAMDFKKIRRILWDYSNNTNSIYYGSLDLSYNIIIAILLK